MEEIQIKIKKGQNEPEEDIQFKVHCGDEPEEGIQFKVHCGDEPEEGVRFKVTTDNPIA